MSSSCCVSRIRVRLGGGVWEEMRFSSSSTFSEEKKGDQLLAHLLKAVLTVHLPACHHGSKGKVCQQQDQDDDVFQTGALQRKRSLSYRQGERDQSSSQEASAVSPPWSE